MPEDIDIDAIIRNLEQRFNDEERGMSISPGTSGSDISDVARAQQKEAYEAEEIPSKGKLVYDKETGKIFSAEDGAQAKDPLRRVVPGAEDGSLYDYELSDKTQKELDEILEKLGDLCITNSLPAVIQIQVDRKGTTAGIRRYRAPEDFFRRAIQPIMLMHTCERLLCSDNVTSEDIESIMITLMNVSMAQDLRRGRE